MIIVRRPPPVDVGIPGSHEAPGHHRGRSNLLVARSAATVLGFFYNEGGPMNYFAVVLFWASMSSICLAAPGGGTPIAGDKIDLRDSATSAKRKAAFRTTNEPAIDLATLPDPRRHGATLQVVGSGPGFGDTGVVPLPAEFWRGLGNPAGSRGYGFRDRSLGNGVRDVRLIPGRRGGRFSFAARGENWAFTLAQPQQSVEVRLTIDSRVYCARFPAATMRRNDEGRLQARGAAAPADCRVGRCGDGIVGSGEECDDGNLLDGDCCSAACLLEPDGSPCDDGAFCTATDTCSAGACGGAGNVCDDGVDCTVDRCDEEREACTNDPHDAFCDDLLACNGLETCDRLVGCEAGVPPDPNCAHLDGPCTEGACNQLDGSCEAVPLEKEGCPEPGPTDGEGASALPIAVEWLDDLRGGPRALGRLTAQVSNTTSEPIEVSVAAVGAGLDQRFAEAIIRPRLRIDPGKPRKIQIALRQVPVQSVGSLSSLSLHAVIARPDGHSVVVPSDPIYLDFDPSYRSATVHPAAAAHVELSRSDVASVDDLAERIDAIVAGLFDQPGRVLATIDGRQRLVDVNDLRDRETDVDLRPAGSVVVKAGDLGGGTSPNIPGYFDGFDYIDFPGAQPLVRICSHWRGLWVDAGFGEDYLASKTTHDVPARYAQVRIGKGSRTLVFSGNLDSTGCVQLHLEPGEYYMVQFPHLEAGSVKVHGDYQANIVGTCTKDPSQLCDVPSDCVVPGNPVCWKKSTPDYTNFAVIGFLVPNPLTPLHPNPNLYPTWHDDLTRVMGVMGQVMATPDSGLTLPILDTYLVHADETCSVGGQTTGGCANGRDLFIGKRPNPFPGELHNSLFKHVIAHEFGHVQHGLSMARPEVNVGIYSTDVADSLCNCDQVVSANTLHCLQSLEQGAAAMIEGYAQFYAAKVFNDPSDNDCVFAYYKEFRDVGGTVRPVPNVHDCRTPKMWWHSHCFYPPATHVGFDLGTELDWQVFFWNVNTVGPYSSTMADLKGIFDPACETRDCARWIDVAAESIDYYGLTLPADHFITTGIDNGIPDTP